MSKRLVIFLVAVGLLALAAGVGTLVVANLPYPLFGPPVFTEEIPESRPPRLDREQLERFAGQPMERILETLIEERAAERAKVEPPKAPDPTTAARLLTSLPDTPLPFPRDAAPADEEWLRRFVTDMNPEEGRKPTERECRQFNLALAGLDVDPSQIPASLRRETRPTPESDTFAIRLVARDHSLRGPFALGDFDGDGRREIACEGGSALFRFEAEGSPERLDRLRDIVPGNGLHPADYDDDGDLDLFVTRGDGLPDSLLRNEGEGRFVDATVQAGLLAFADTAAAAWLDCDGDGRLDLLVGSRDHPLALHRQTTDGGFRSVAWDRKLWVPRGASRLEVADVSGDGRPDFFVGIEGMADRLYLNEPGSTLGEGHFRDIAPEIGLPAGEASATARFVDFDGDGDSDLLLGRLAPAKVTANDENARASDEGRSKPTNEPPGPAGEATKENDIAAADPPGEAESPPGALHLYRNEGGATFRDVTEAAELGGVDEVTALGACDIDNDGLPDLFVGTPTLAMNRVFWNRGGTFFREVSVASRGSHLDRPIRFAATDLGEDGTPDLLYRSRSGRIRWLRPEGPLGHWLAIELTGHAPGTRVEATVRDPDWVMHTVNGRFHRETKATLGLGEAAVVERLAVFPPGAEEPVETRADLEPNRHLALEITNSAVRDDPAPENARQANPPPNLDETRGDSPKPPATASASDPDRGGEQAQRKP